MCFLGQGCFHAVQRELRLCVRRVVTITILGLCPQHPLVPLLGFSWLFWGFHWQCYLRAVG